jgi:hypothetical protein
MSSALSAPGYDPRLGHRSGAFFPCKVDDRGWQCPCAFTVSAPVPISPIWIALGKK